jgi:preprotein translocase subunit SecE
MNRFFNYLRDTRGELKHVSWPTQQQTILYTILVIVLSIITGIYLGLLDFLFKEGLNLFVF